MMRARCRLQARAASVVAQTDVNVLVLQRRDFDSLLGPLQKLLDAQVATYGPYKAEKPTESSKVGLLGILNSRVSTQATPVM